MPQPSPYRYRTTSYEEKLFKGYVAGHALGRWPMPLLPLVNGLDRHGNEVCSENLLRFNGNKYIKGDPASPLYNTLAPDPSRLAYPNAWSQTCAIGAQIEGRVHSVYVLTGKSTQVAKHTHKACVRPVIAFELQNLIL